MIVGRQMFCCVRPSKSIFWPKLDERLSAHLPEEQLPKVFVNQVSHVTRSWCSCSNPMEPCLMLSHKFDTFWKHAGTLEQVSTKIQAL